MRTSGREEEREQGRDEEGEREGLGDTRVK